MGFFSRKPKFEEAAFEEATDVNRVRELLLTLGEKTQYTPDVPHLLRKRAHLVLFVDAMQDTVWDRVGKGLLPHGNTKLAAAFTRDYFAFWKKDLGDETQAIPMNKLQWDVPFAPIKGEVHEVNSETIFELDTQHRNGVEFIRERVQVRIPYTTSWTKKEGTEWTCKQYQEFSEGNLNVWMYVGVPDYWNPLIRSGVKFKHRDKDWNPVQSRVTANGVFKPVRVFKPNNPTLQNYYYFTVREYED